MDNLTHSCNWMEQKKTAATNGEEHYQKTILINKPLLIFMNNKSIRMGCLGRWF